MSLFQSTHPVRGATFNPPHSSTNERFQSTHPVRGATSNFFRADSYNWLFQSTHPVRGATLGNQQTMQFADIFQSTHPVRGATRFIGQHVLHSKISIHAPREGCDVSLPVLSMVAFISIHAPREGCDAASARNTSTMEFQSTHPVRGATSGDEGSRPKPSDFNPRTP